MKISLVLLLFLSVACGSLKNRQEAAEEAKQKALSAEQNAPTGPIDEDIPDGAPAAEPTASDDQVLNDELAAMGIDPNNPDGIKHGTPEPEDNAPAPAVKKAAAKKPALKKPVKKTDPKKKKKPVKKKN